jgi:hypothetical protein
MEQLGYYPNLQAGMTMATNAAQPMNFTGGDRSSFQETLYCELANAVFQFIYPDEAALKCSSRSEEVSMLARGRW